ncbi:hypothetical protein OIU78_013956 [Salix suchowensis]|nr:hypothetical protein OIU78_013956 [Salix suchowensis]
MNTCGKPTELALSLSNGMAGPTLCCKIQGCYFIRAYELDFSRNNITGIIDPRLFPDGSAASKTGLVSLKNFLLQTTGLGGRIPEEIGNCKFLSLLALDENRFYGPIPSSLGNLSELTVLRLSGNLFSGNIPPNIGTLSKLTDLRLLTNQLSGFVPAELGNLSSLTISGELPAQLGKLSNLLVLNLKDNMLSGQQVPCFFHSHWVVLLHFSTIGTPEMSQHMEADQGGKFLSQYERKAVDLLSRVITLARSCTRVDPRSRPTMRTVSQLLEMKAAGSE